MKGNRMIARPVKTTILSIKDSYGQDAQSIAAF
jgi:hypothetical protein